MNVFKKIINWLFSTKVGMFLNAILVWSLFSAVLAYFGYADAEYYKLSLYVLGPIMALVSISINWDKKWV